MNIEELREKQMKYYDISVYKPEKVKITKLNIDRIISQLCFIVDYLIRHEHTLTHICLNDFEMCDDTLFLKRDARVVSIDSKHKFTYKKDTDKMCFPNKGLVDGQKASVDDTYASVGLFIYYLYFKKVVNNISEKDYGKLKGTRPYYFIKNTMKPSPCLIYL